MNIRLSDHFTAGRMIRYTLPSMLMMIFTSIYGMVDGFFISNYAGSTQFAAVNLIMPFIMIMGVIGTVFGSGGSALISMKMGMGEKEEANQIFSFLVWTAIITGAVLSVFGFFMAGPVAELFGASEKMYPYCVTYCRILMFGNIQFILQYMFQVMMPTAEKPGLGLAITVTAGCTNMVLDFLFVGVLRMGVNGAALATVLCQTVGGVLPLIYFASKKNPTFLHLCHTHFSWKWLGKTAGNGSSEFMTNVATSLVSILYNFQLMKWAGSDGVAAYGVIMYGGYIFMGVYFGFSMGISPVISYHYGAGNTAELKGLFKRSLCIIAGFMVVLVTAAEIFARPISAIFVGYDRELLDFTTNAFMIYSLSYVVMVFNIFGSSLFTALNNGGVSALISFARTLVFESASVMILPEIFKSVNGIWSAVIAAEVLCLILTITCVMKFRNRYHYL